MILYRGRLHTRLQRIEGDRPVYTHTYIHTCAPQIHAHVHINMILHRGRLHTRLQRIEGDRPAYTHTYIHTCAPHIHAHVHINMILYRGRLHTRLKRIEGDRPAYTHTYIHTCAPHIHAHACTHAHDLYVSRSSCPSKCSITLWRASFLGSRVRVKSSTRFIKPSSVALWYIK